MRFLTIEVDETKENVDKFVADVHNSGIINSRDNEEGFILKVWNIEEGQDYL